MYQIDNEKFGQFLSDLRKEKSMTQKMMATLYYGMIPAHAGTMFDQSFDADPIIKSKMFTITNMINSHSKPPI